MDYITIIKGDDTNFLEDQFIIINFKTDFSMSGFTATFTLDDVTLTYGDLSEKKLEIILPKEITSNLKIGKQYGELKLIDTQNRIRTVTSVIPFLVKNGVNEQITYINNALNIITNINDTTIEIIIETAGIAKTEAENILAGCNLASQNAQNCSNISQTLSLRMDEQVTTFTARQNELNIAVANAVDMCEQNLTDMSAAETTALTNIHNATANLDDTVTTGLSNIASAKNNALTSINSAIANLDDTVSDGLDDILSAKTDALSSINTNKTSSLSELTESKSGALSEITTSRNNALSLISTAQNTAETLINTGISNINQGLSDISDGLDDISDAETNALNNIESSETSALNSIAGAKNQAIEDISDIAGVDFTAFALNSDLADVATSGSYNDLLNKPTIPTVPTNISAFTNDSGYLTQHQDISGKANSSDLAAVATSGSYNDLLNKPTIPTVPTNVSAFTNDAGYLTSHQSLASKEDVHKPTYNRTSITTLSLDTNKIYVCTASSSYVYFFLPSLDYVQRTKFNQILVQLYMGTVVPVDLGTTLFFNGEEPDMSDTGYYNIIYEYDYTVGHWACGVIKKSAAA